MMEFPTHMERKEEAQRVKKAAELEAMNAADAENGE